MWQMLMNLIGHVKFRVLMILILGVSVLFLSNKNVLGSTSRLKIHENAYTAEEFEKIIDGYKAQSKVLGEQIKSVERDLDWLAIKINRILETGRTVSYKLEKNIKSKKKRAQLLRNDKAQVDQALSKYERTLKSMMPKQVAGLIQNQLFQATVSQPSKPVISPVAKTIAQKASATLEHSNELTDKRSKIEDAIRKAGLEDWVSVTDADGGCAKVKNTLPILFSSGSAVLAKEYAQFLKKLSNFLKPYNVRILVSGYADPDPIKTKQYPSNFELGASRAATIVHEMVKYGLKPSIFKIGSTGEYRFAAKKGTTKKSFQRQAEVIVVFNA